MEDLGQSLPYRVVRVLGEGSHGVVLEVEHKRLGKPFVVKLIQQKFSENRDVVQRFVAEAQRVARLDHEAFVPIVDLGETDDGRAYFVMEYVAGVTLQQALRDRGAFDLAEGVRLGAELLDGLAVAHGAHIVHRDIKPANLFLTARGRLKILDFGISKSMIDSGTGVQTAHGIAIGTPRYMSPEQAYGNAVSPATDVYAAGLVVHELLTGQAVFDGADSKSILFAQIHTPAPTLAERAGRPFPASVEAVVARALRKEPAARYQSAAEMAAALRASLGVASIPAPAASPDQTQDERVRPTLRVSDAPSSTGHDTRPVSAEALVVGAASTSQAVVVGPPPTPDEVDATARTEALPAMGGPVPFVAPGGTASSSLAPAPAALAPAAPAPVAPASIAAPVVAPRQDTTIAARPRSPLLVVATFVGALGLALAAIFGVVYVVRTRGEGVVGAASVSAPSATAKAAAASASSSPPAAPEAPSASAASAPPSSAPSHAPSGAATPPPTSVAGKPPSAPSASASAKKPTHYAAAVEAMNAGDLEVADAEARLAVAEGGGVSAQLLLAQILERRGKKAAARDVYAKILETNPTMAAAVAGLKRCGG